MIIRKLAASEKAIYNKVVDHPLQSWEWGEFRESLGREVERLGVFERGRLVEGWQIIFHQIPYTNFTVGYFPRGPLPNRRMVSALKELGKEHRAIFIKIEPNVVKKLWRNNKGKIEAEPAEENKLNLASLELTPSSREIFDRYTFVLKVDLPETELLQRMYPKTRYNIRLAQKKGILVEHDNSQSSLAIFLRLFFGETLKRQGFYMHNPDYFRKMWDILSPAGVSHLLLAKYKERVLAAWILFIWKKKLYYPYGASSSQLRNLMASNLICWEAILLGKKKGCRFFDMWGCLPPDADLSHPWYGFHRFKMGYGGDLVEYAGSWDLVLNKPLYRLYGLADNLRWKLLRLRRKMGK
jgi:lipid II:glycine glycyltransferase (peptidoglycan interpeptide bridge formation enzyme)